MKILLSFVILILFKISSTENHNITNSGLGERRRYSKRSYVCPPNFIRISHRCYFFSKEIATWQDAFYQCRDMHSNLAIIKNANQDKLIRRMLSKKSLEPLERWLGGKYDWEQMNWKWAASGKSLTYQGFHQLMENGDKEKLFWHCIIMDPQLQFKWNSRSCLEAKHYICHTKIKIVNKKGKKKLQKQYKVNKDNQLNEIPVPILPENYLYNNNNNNNNNITNLNDNKLKSQYSLRPKQLRRRKGKRNHKRKLLHNNKEQINKNIIDNNQLIYNNDDVWRKNRIKKINNNKEKDKNNIFMENIKWKTYYKDVTISPLHPKPIVEEYSYMKEYTKNL